jgi:hypothetical protein
MMGSFSGGGHSSDSTIAIAALGSCASNHRKYSRKVFQEKIWKF